jgi:poly(beta-D-mannuronate) lyase
MLVALVRPGIRSPHLIPPSSQVTNLGLPPRGSAARWIVGCLLSNSAAIDSAAGSYPEVAVDVDGHMRAGAKDVGADEFSTAPILRRPLTAADLGPNAP